jgi:hypothetical protein
MNEKVLRQSTLIASGVFLLSCFALLWHVSRKAEFWFFGSIEEKFFWSLFGCGIFAAAGVLLILSALYKRMYPIFSAVMPLLVLAAWLPYQYRLPDSVCLISTAVLLLPPIIYYTFVKQPSSVSAPGAGKRNG